MMVLIKKLFVRLAVKLKEMKIFKYFGVLLIADIGTEGSVNQTL